MAKVSERRDSDVTGYVSCAKDQATLNTKVLVEWNMSNPAPLLHTPGSRGTRKIAIQGNQITKSNFVKDS